MGGRSLPHAASSLALLALLTAGCGGGGTAAGNRPHVQPLAPCRHEDVALATGARISPETGEEALAFEVRLRGDAACTVQGSPRVRLLDDHGRVMAFRYLHRALYASNAPATQVVVRRGRPGVFLVAKYRCDVTTYPLYPARARIRLPHVPGSYDVPLHVHGAARIPLCGKGDPPQDLGTSPVRAGYPGLYPG